MVPALLLIRSLAAAAVATGLVPVGELPEDLAACLHEAGLAHFSHDLDRQRELLEHAETLEGRPEDTARVQRQLALLDWKYELEDDAAGERLMRATSGPEPGAAWLALARLELEREHHAEARRAAVEASRLGKDAETRRRGRIAAVLASTAEAAALRRSGEDARTAALESARDVALEIVRAEPGLLDPSKALVRAAVLTRDGPSLLLAWRSYYHVGEDGEMPNGVAAPGAEVARLAPRLGTEELSAGEHVALVDALRASHFHEAAALLALDPALNAPHRNDPRVRGALAYADFVRDLRLEVDEYYRQTAVGRTTHRQLDGIVRDAVKALHEAVDEPGRAPSSESARWEWLLERFGADGRGGTTSGYYDLHVGHVVSDETRPITQYEHTADLRHVVLDHMVSNGFQSWAWSSGAQHGGWAGRDAMWQVRPAYADETIDIWRQMHDPESRAELLERIERESRLDDERAREDPVSHLPGLVDRLRRQEVEGLLGELEERGLSGPALRVEFIREMTRAVQAYSIFAHEGRHAIDHRIGDFDTATLEYRAKLSQVAFAPRPRLAVGGIVSPNIGDPTPHGQANERALEGVVKWMDRHADEIDDLDRERPLLPQLDLLTDDQLRAAFRSMDPLAPKDD